MRIRIAALVFLLACCFSNVVLADTLSIASPAPQFAQPYSNYFGQTFTVSGVGVYNDIQFTFLSNSLSPFATGTGFLLTQQYLGSPGGLSSSTAGYLASANAAGGFYTFANNVLLSANQTYYLYDNALAPANSIGSASTPGAQPLEYYATQTSAFTPSSYSWAYEVTGDSAVTPEPSTLALLGTGVLGLAGAIRRRLSTWSPAFPYLAADACSKVARRICLPGHVLVLYPSRVTRT